MSAATEITVAFEGKRVVRVAPAGITKALQALKICQDDLLRGWNIDPAERERVAEPAQAVVPDSKLLSWVDYPKKALDTGSYGTSIIVWTIGIDGTVSGCRTVIGSGTEALDKAACLGITRNARYRPAAGQDGQPMVTHHVRRIRWSLPY